jgi:uncharacterized protein YjbI with pentapeptide repeats
LSLSQGSGKCKRGADLREANLFGADLREADLRQANLFETDLRGSDLRGAILNRSDLFQAILNRARFRGANLFGAILKEPDLREIIAAGRLDAPDATSAESLSTLYYSTASEAARYLSEKLGRSISVNYIRKLAHRKKHPVRTQPMGDRLLYHRDDIENATIRQMKRKH